jgi:hypothetical protein
MRLSIALCWTTIVAVGFTACGSSTEPRPRASLAFSGSVNASDTALAVLAQPLVVEVRDSTGALAAPGTAVEFTSAKTPATELEILQGVGFGATDAAGQVRMTIRLGITAGTSRLAVRVPALGLEDTARFTVTAGHARRMGVVPRDTALYVGKSFTLRGGIVDRSGNPIPDPVTWSSADPGLTVSSTGVVTAAALGRYYVKAVGALGTDSGAVTVVPPARLAGLVHDVGSSSFTIVTIDADGSNETPLAIGTYGQSWFPADPVWIPGTGTVAYTTVAVKASLYVVGSDRVAKPFHATTPPTFGGELEPTPSADGKWMYFSAYDMRCSVADLCIARAKIDGSAPELLLTTSSSDPAPSPDGAKVAYMAVANSTIRVLDVAGGTTLPWSVPGSNPAWSPDGTQIAYRQYDGRVALIAPDGTGQRTLSPEFVSSLRGWSADGKWLLVEFASTAKLMSATTGLVLPLGYSSERKMLTSLR